MYVIVKGSRRNPDYLGFDADGHHEWAQDRLEAIRFSNNDDAIGCCGQYIATGARIVQVDRWDGQVFKDNVKGPGGGHRWRYRFGPVTYNRAYTYAPGNMGYTTPEAALQAARNAVTRAKSRHSHIVSVSG
jgi:hypothetical protein